MALLGAAMSPVALYRSGARVGGVQLLEIRPHAVLLSSDAEESPCWLKMERPNPNAPAPAPAAPPPEKPKSKKDRKKAFTTEELQRGIQQIGPGIYRVDRNVLNQALARVPKLAKTTRTKTVKRNGQAVGMSLHRIEEGGLFEHLGLKRGDVLKTVNGFDFSSIDGVLSAKTQLTTAPRLSLSLTRQGHPMTLEYRVQ
jgi:type II secretory pathway component PulC